MHNTRAVAPALAVINVIRYTCVGQVTVFTMGKVYMGDPQQLNYF